MRRTYSYNAIWIGLLIGLLVEKATGNTALSVIAMVVSIVGVYLGIRAFERMLYQGAISASNALTKVFDQRYRLKQSNEKNTVSVMATTPSENTNQPIAYCTNCGAKLPAQAKFCIKCGTPVPTAVSGGNDM